LAKLHSRLMLLSLLLLLATPFVMLLSGFILLGRDWRTADRSSSGIAPDPEITHEALVQVYAARALNWRGIFGVHTWIATKTENAPQYTVHQVMGWRLWRNLPAVASRPDIPDRYWFGNMPEVIAELRGAEASAAIPKVVAAVNSYPYAQQYRLWPGPNSNTFTAHLARHVPELEVQLPVTAMGKDYPTNGGFLDRAPSGTGYQLSIYGLLGMIVAWQEGVELNLLGFSFGLDLNRPALKLPFLGRLGFKEAGSEKPEN
jgi:hypothetical protein